MSPPPDGQAQAAERRTVICLGDSHTRGFYGASWLRLLRPKLRHLRFVNAGNDGEPSPTILARLPALLAAHPAPAAVTIFSGSNDCIAQESASLQRVYSWRFGLQQPCSEQGALDNALAMVEMVRQQAPQAKVFVILLPILVEDPRHGANKRAHAYSTALAQAVSSRYPSSSSAVTVIDFQALCREHMAQHSPAWRDAVAAQQDTQQQQQQPEGGGNSSSLSVLSMGLGMSWAKFYQSWLLGRRWDDISRMQGMQLLTDHVHINDTAAKLLADELLPHLQQL